MTRTLSIAQQFSRTPGPRFESEGQFSGEEFRRTVLLPLVREAMGERSKLAVDLDGTAGYGTSFLEEAFGGLVRHDNIKSTELLALLEFKSNEEPYLTEDVRTYITEATPAQ